MAVTVIDNLRDGNSSKAMNVNGSSVAKTFTYTPGEGVTVEINGLNILLEDVGSSSLGNFGALAGLTNGVLLEVSVGGVTTNLSVLKDNADIITRFRHAGFGSGAVSTLGAPIGFGDSADMVVGYMMFKRPVMLTGSDFIKVTVRDNLTNLGTFEIAYDLCKD